MFTYRYKQLASNLSFGKIFRQPVLLPEESLMKTYLILKFETNTEKKFKLHKISKMRNKRTYFFLHSHPMKIRNISISIAKTKTYESRSVESK